MAAYAQAAAQFAAVQYNNGIYNPEIFHQMFKKSQDEYMIMNNNHTHSTKFGSGKP
jgi:hypothetical protein